jgi:cephalosporin hydroxylase
MNYIHSIIDTAYTKYSLVQHHNEYFKFCEFYQELRCKNIMEIGSYLGGNFYAMCKLSNPIGIKISLDCPLYQDQTVQIKLNNTYVKMKNFAEDVHLVHTDSHLAESKNQVASILGEQKLDFLFIDGDHIYDGVKQDFEMYSPFVKKGGYIAFHDINDTEFHRGLNCHVAKFWNELDYKYKVEFNSKSFCMGIGVIQV